MEWKIDGAKDLPLAVIENTEDGHGVAEIGERTADNIKNAHLIAAAPELLEACKLALYAINQRLEVDGAKTGAFKSELKAILLLEKATDKAQGN